MPLGDDRRRRPAASTRSRRNAAVKGVLTHGHLPENDHHGGAPGIAARRHQAPRRPALRRPVDDRRLRLRPGRPVARPAPTAARRRSAPGQSLTFVNDDAARHGQWHTITACRAPCNGDDRHRLPAGQRRRSSSTRASSASGRRASRRPPTATDMVDADDPAGRHLHLLLPDPPVHARRVPREGVAAAPARRPAAARRSRRAGGGVGRGPGRAGRRCSMRPRSPRGPTLASTTPSSRSARTARCTPRRTRGSASRWRSCARPTRPACRWWASASAARRSPPPWAPR